MNELLSMALNIFILSIEMYWYDKLRVCENRQQLTVTSYLGGSEEISDSFLLHKARPTQFSATNANFFLPAGLSIGL